MIVIPNTKILNEDLYITDLVKKIVQKFNLFQNLVEKIIKNYYKKNCYILLTRVSDGQKSYEEFYGKEDKIFKDNDKSFYKINLPNYDYKINKILNKIIKFKQ